MKAPFSERKTSARGFFDLLTGCYPGFLFGGRLGGILPVFHFHDVTSDYLEPYLQYLSGNGYRTVTSGELTAFVKDGVSIGDKTVVLTFDDAWASVSSVVGPLLKKYNMKAITYAIPCRIGDAGQDSPFASWQELRELQKTGIMDVQAHTYSHARVFCSDEITGFVGPDMDMSLLSWPVLKSGKEPVFLSAAMLGCPFYFSRSRMSDAVRFLPDKAAQKECMEHVRRKGGENFFERPGWELELLDITGGSAGRYETIEEQKKEIRDDLSLAKNVLEEKLDKTITQICLPWGVCGELAEELVKDVGYEAAVADSMLGKRYARPRTNQYRIMRLKHQLIYCLPGKERKSVFKVLSER